MAAAATPVDESALLVSSSDPDCNLLHAPLNSQTFQRLVHLDEAHIPANTPENIDVGTRPQHAMALQALLSNRRWADEMLLITQSGNASRARSICQQLQRHGFSAASVLVTEIQLPSPQKARLSVAEAARFLRRDAGLVSLVTRDDIDAARLPEGWSQYASMQDVPAGVPGVLVVDDPEVIEGVFSDRVILLEGQIGGLVDYVSFSARRGQLQQMAMCRR